YAYSKALEWADADRLFTKRAGFALMAYLSLKSSQLTDEQYGPFMDLIKKHANDDRNLVKKAISWALRQIGKRNANLHAEAVQLSQGLLEFNNKEAKWIGRDALKELDKPELKSRLTAKGAGND
ncbi:MAG: DNA alkylation repair protein, partial [Candidatus Marinimicrobia bacterium]|nr:DNA alkylation repair protein [Candidatus Neomarinimicrobiota bacterium]